MKDVTYDHNDKSLPHEMLFALKDIIAGREVSYDYNFYKGNIKWLSNICCCGSSECNGYNDNWRLCVILVVIFFLW